MVKLVFSLVTVTVAFLTYMNLPLGKNRIFRVHVKNIFADKERSKKKVNACISTEP